MSMYLQYLPEGIVIRRKGDGETDEVETMLGPGELATMLEEHLGRWNPTLDEFREAVKRRLRWHLNRQRAAARSYLKDEPGHMAHTMCTGLIVLIFGDLFPGDDINANHPGMAQAARPGDLRAGAAAESEQDFRSGPQTRIVGHPLA